VSHPDLITDADDLLDLAEDLMESDVVAFDCEFHSEGRYVPDLCLVQIADSEGAVAIDPRGLDLAPLGPVMADPGIRKVVHAGHQDVILMALATGSELVNVFDTQVGAAFAGFGNSVGFARLAEATLGVRLSKSSQYTRWDGPLTDEQVAYALDDARYLLGIAVEIRKQLEKKNRLAWAEEESQRVLHRALRRPEPEQLWRRVKGTARLNRNELGILRELAIWRDMVAEAANKPLNAVANDAALAQLACRPPTEVEALRDSRGIGVGASRRWWSSLCEAIERGKQRPEIRPPSRRTEKSVEGALRILSIVRRKSSEEHGIAPNLLGSEADTRALVSWVLEGRPDDEPLPKLLTGWRRELLGDEMLHFIDGDAAIVIDLESATGTRALDL